MNHEQLRQLDSESLHLEAIAAAESCQSAEVYLLKVLEVVDEQQYYLECGVTSLYQYCTSLLHLSESISYALIAVIRKGREVPELKLAIEQGRVTLSKAKKICSVITPADHDAWIELASHETSRVIEKCVAQANPKAAVRESLQYKTADRLEFKLGVSEEWVELLNEVKDLLSQQGSVAVGSEEALKSVMREFVERHSPIKKAERAVARAEKRKMKKTENELVPGPVVEGTHPIIATRARRKSKRRPIKRITVHAVNLRDQNQCTHVSSLGRCTQKRWLEVHHVVPVSESDSNDLDNLSTLCCAHHKLKHRVLDRSKARQK